MLNLETRTGNRSRREARRGAVCFDPTMAMTDYSRTRQSASGLLGYAEALLVVAGSTLAGLVIAHRWGIGPVVLLYLPPVLAAAILRGLGPALVAAVASTLSYNFFFTAPYRTLLIHSPADAVTVVVLFLVALVTSHLAGSMREHARLAEAHASRNATIAGLARRLLSRTSEAEIAQVAVEDLARLFGCNALLAADTDDPQLIASTPPGATLNPSDRAAAMLSFQTGESSGRGVSQANLADWQFHPVVAGQAVIAAVGLARDDGMPPLRGDQLPLLGNLLDQVALALERARLEHEAREFAMLRERDRIRSALLSSIGEDVRPRLTAIAGAARALRRNGGGDKALISSIASEAAMLDRYVDNLVDLRPGSDQEPVEVGPIAIDLYRRSVRRDGIEVHLTPKEYAVLAELAKHRGRVLTHAQLLRSVWGPAQERQIEYLRVAVRALRKKLEADPAHPAIIVNEPAVGYRIVSSI
jgi:K+-sensing histidine kinase KdpD/DNA-binding winged helix-turn-helix (wHTH) protein